jgi:hypothetical protein
MQYKVPQFIEVEDKIFGPLTFKQFVYLAGAGGIALVLVSVLPLWLALLFAAPFAVLGGALAFYRVDDRPLVVVLEHAFNYVMGHKLYLWKHRDASAPIRRPSVPVKAAAPLTPVPPKFSESKLKDLAWSLNIKDRIAEETEEQ